MICCQVSQGDSWASTDIDNSKGSSLKYLICHQQMSVSIQHRKLKWLYDYMTAKLHWRIMKKIGK